MQPSSTVAFTLHHGKREAAEQTVFEAVPSRLHTHITHTHTHTHTDTPMSSIQTPKAIVSKQRIRFVGRVTLFTGTGTGDGSRAESGGVGEGGGEVWPDDVVGEEATA